MTTVHGRLIPTDMDADATAAVCGEVFDERVDQHDQWGQQDHPWVNDGVLAKFAGDESLETLEHEVKAVVDNAAADGTLAFSLILFEELVEAVAAGTAAEARDELVQVAAVAVAAIEAIDREASS